MALAKRLPQVDRLWGKFLTCSLVIGRSLDLGGFGNACSDIRGCQGIHVSDIARRPHSTGSEFTIYSSGAAQTRI